MLKKTSFHIAAAAVLLLSGNAVYTAQAQIATGTVLETMNAAGYTYLHIDNGMAKEWVAIPESQVSVGEKVNYDKGMEMANFYSKSLDKTFPTIIFSAGLAQESGTVSPHGSNEAPPADSFSAAVAQEQKGVPMSAAPIMGETSGGSTGAVVPFSEVTVEKAPGENSYTVEEIFTQADSLDGSTIRLRGKVVKFNANIMGRNWVHLQDGSGNPMNNTHDLVVTTGETVSPDDIVIIEGKLTAKKDFGAGYKYEAIVEEAKLIQ